MVEIARRDTKEKAQFAVENITQTISGLLDDIQQNMFNKAKAFRDENITKVDDFETFQKLLDEKPGFISTLGRHCRNRRQNKRINQSNHSLYSFG
jgi:prolyl-tRNA synthetase